METSEPSAYLLVVVLVILPSASREESKVVVETGNTFIASLLFVAECILCINDF
jgi:hypothetical protein